MPDPKPLIVHADDLGLSASFNEGIRRAATEGFLTSTCLRTNGTAFITAVRDVLPACPHLGVGVHLNLVEGRTGRRTRRSSPLYTADGWYRYSAAALGSAVRQRAVLQEIEAEFRDQIETVLRECRPDHLNGHQHCHAFPPIFEIACRLAREYGIPYIRVPHERLKFAGGHYPIVGLGINLVKMAAMGVVGGTLRRLAARHGIATNGAFVGLLYTGYMDEQSIFTGLRAARPRGGPVEMLLHPCADAGCTSDEYWPGIRDYVMSGYRARELAALTNAAIEERLRSEGWELTNYSRLAGWTAPAAAPRPAIAARPRLRVVAIIDETPFYQPDYVRRLAVESRHADLVAVARVVHAGGGIVQRYMLRNWRRLGVREFVTLGVKSVALQLAGHLPRALRGTHEGTLQNVLRRLGIPTRTISSVRTEEFHEWVRSFRPDVVLSSNSLIFPESLIAIPRLAAINRHTALLPSYGGILPAFRAVQKGEAECGVSVHLMTRGIDEGPVIARRRIPIQRGDTLDRLYRLAFTVSVDATEEAFARIREHQGPPPPLSNDGLAPSYYSFPTPEDWEEFRRRGGRFI